MAPYISSHLRDRVWLVPACQGTQLDILQNLVANTRPQQSAMACLSAPVPLPCSGRSRPAGRKTSVRQGQRAVVDSGWSPLCGTVVLAEWCGPLGHRNRLITRTSDLSAWTVV